MPNEIAIISLDFNGAEPGPPGPRGPTGLTLAEMAPYLDPADFAELSSPATRPDRCVWCGGVWRHSKLCDELQRCWLSPFPWGKYKGKPLRTVPGTYLVWALTRDLPAELRRDVLKEIEYRRREGRQSDINLAP